MNKQKEIITMIQRKSFSSSLLLKKKKGQAKGMMNTNATTTALNSFVEELSRLLSTPLIEGREGEDHHHHHHNKTRSTKFDNCNDVIEKAIHELQASDNPEDEVQEQARHQQTHRFVLVSDNARVFAKSRPQQQQQQQYQSLSLSSNSLQTSPTSMESMTQQQRSVSSSPLIDRNVFRKNKQRDRWISDSSITISGGSGGSGISRSMSTASSGESIATTTGSSNSTSIERRRSSVDSCLNIPKRSFDNEVLSSASLPASASAAAGRVIRKLQKRDSIELTQAAIEQYNKSRHSNNKSGSNNHTTATTTRHSSSHRCQRTLSESSDQNFSWHNIKDITPIIKTSNNNSCNGNSNSNISNYKHGTATTTYMHRRTRSDGFFLLPPVACDPSSSSYYQSSSNSNSNSTTTRRTRSAADAVSKLQRALGTMAPQISSSRSRSKRKDTKTTATTRRGRKKEHNGGSGSGGGGGGGVDSRRRGNNSKSKNSGASAAASASARSAATVVVSSSSSLRLSSSNFNDNHKSSSSSSSSSSLQSQLQQPKRYRKQQRRASLDTAPKIAVRISSDEFINKRW